MGRSYDAIVLGLGAVGSAAAYQLAKRGSRTLGIDQFSPPHNQGSTHGDTRITRQAIGEGAHYIPLSLRSYELFQEAERETGADLLTICGGLILSSEGVPTDTHVPAFFNNTLASARAYAIAVGERDWQAEPVHPDTSDDERLLAARAGRHRHGLRDALRDAIIPHLTPGRTVRRRQHALAGGCHDYVPIRRLHEAGAMSVRRHAARDLQPVGARIAGDPDAAAHRADVPAPRVSRIDHEAHHTAGQVEVGTDLPPRQPAVAAFGDDAGSPASDDRAVRRGSEARPLIRLG